MKLASLIRRRSREAVATATPATPATEPGSRAPTVAGIATVAVANAPKAQSVPILSEGTVARIAVAKREAGGVAEPAPDTLADASPEVRSSAWVLHYADRQPTETWFAPPVTHAEVMASTPDAVAAEPVLERVITRTADLIEREELRALIAAVYAGDTDQDRQEATEAALADPGGALACYRAIAAERGIEVRTAQVTGPVTKQTDVVGCRSCRHRKRPGLSAGYCGGDRVDLHGAYGANHPLRQLPADQGATCASYQSHE